MLLFRSEEWIERWCKQNQLKRGEVLTLNRVWELSKLWYQDRLSLDYHGRTVEQAEEIFKQAGLTSVFWNMYPLKLSATYDITSFDSSCINNGGLSYGKRKTSLQSKIRL